MDDGQRDAILDVAARAFAAHGYERASYNAILDACGLSKSSAYHAFTGKADLYGVVIGRAVERLFLSVPAFPDDVRTPDAFFAALRAWLEHTLAVYASDPESAALVEGFIAAKKAGLLPDVDHGMDDVAAASFAAILDVGRQAGAVRDDVEPLLLAGLVGQLIATLDFHFLPRLPSLDDDARDRTLALYVDLIRRVVSPTPASSERR